MAIQWRSWRPIHATTFEGGAFTYSNLTPVAVSTKLGDVNLFAVDKQGSMYQTYWDKQQWQLWRPLGGVLNNIPSVVARGPGLLDVVCLGRDNRMYHKAYDGNSWVNWNNGRKSSDMKAWGAPIGEPVRNTPLSIVAWGPKESRRLDVFAIGTGGNLLHMYTNDGQNWYGHQNETRWEDLGGICIGPPVALSRAENHLDVFVLGKNNHLHYKPWNGHHWVPSQQGWNEHFPGTVVDTPAIVSRMGATLDIVCRGSSDDRDGYDLKKIYWNGSNDWGPRDKNNNLIWESLGQPFQSAHFQKAPTVISRDENKLDIFCIGDGNVIKQKGIFHKSWNGKTWEPAQITESWSNVNGYDHDGKVHELCAVAVDKNSIILIASFYDERKAQYQLYSCLGLAR